MRLQNSGLVLVAATLALAGSILATSGQAAPRDVLALVAEGTLEMELSAGGAYALDVKLHNVTGTPAEAVFSPGLVADAFGQRQVFAQVRQQQGAQGVGLLESPSISVAANASASITIRGCCLNYGLPEPRRGTALFLKRVEDYTPDTRMHAVLARIATEGVDTQIAQAALWHCSNNISWSDVARLGTPAQGKFSAQQVAAARELLASATSNANIAAARQGSSPSSAGRANGTENQNSDQWAVSQPAANLVVNILPDIRGNRESLTLSRLVAHRLRASYPGLTIRHSNYLVNPSNSNTDQVQWNVMLGIRGGKKAAANDRGVQWTLARATWEPKRQRWQHDRAQTIQDDRTETKNPAALADSLMRELAQRSVILCWSNPREKKELQVQNKLPIPLKDVRVAGPENGEAITLAHATIPPMGKTQVLLDDNQTQALTGNAKVLAQGFTHHRD